jgi:hypothetical protein
LIDHFTVHGSIIWFLHMTFSFCPGLSRDLLEQVIYAVSAAMTDSGVRSVENGGLKVAASAHIGFAEKGCG